MLEQKAAQQSSQEWWQKFLASTPFNIFRRAKALEQAPIEVQFSLAHVFIRELIEQAEAFARLESLDSSLQALSKHQVEVFVREHIGMPLHPGYFMELSRSLWQQGEISLHDSFYLNQESMLVRSQRGVQAATNQEQRDRYELETLQIEGLQEELARELSQGGLTEIPDGSFLKQIAQRYPDFSGKAFAVGQKLLSTMPKSKVHEGDKSYVSVLQAVYLPAPEEYHLAPAQLQKKISQGTYSGRVVTISDSLFYDLTHGDLVRTHQMYNPLPLQSSEEILMQVITRLPPEFSRVWGRQVFIEMSHKLSTEKSGQSLSLLLAKQQSRELEMRRVQPMIEESSKFLAHVLLLELSRATVNDPDFLEFPTRLYYAFGLVASPLLQKLDQPENSSLFFSYDLALENYRSAHPSPQLPALRQDMKVDPQLREKVVRPEFLQQVKSIRLSDEKRKHYNLSLQRLPSFYMNQVTQNSLCNAISFGKFAENGAATLRMPIVQDIFGGKVIKSLREVEQILGDSEGWHLGYCQVKGCPHSGLEQLVGPCDVCMHCHLRSEFADLEFATPESQNNPDFSRSLSQNYGTLEGIRHDFRRLTVSAGDFPLYLLHEGVVRPASSPRMVR